MGCSCSKETEEAPIGINVINAQPAGGYVPRLTPKVQRNPQTGQPIRPEEYMISRDLLRTALHEMAAQIQASGGKTITVIAVGGAVNTIFLRTREATHDIDFFHSSATASEISLISQAGKQVDDAHGGQLGGNWLNNTTALFLKHDMLKFLTREAETQNEVVFQESGLRVLAAPWDYAFCSKLDRISKGTGREYDATDAATYLNRYVLLHGNAPVEAAATRKWAKLYQTQVTDRDLQTVNAEYQRLFGGVGIVI